MGLWSSASLLVGPRRSPVPLVVAPGWRWLEPAKAGLEDWCQREGAHLWAS
jgi:hypothetical protein